MKRLLLPLATLFVVGSLAAGPLNAQDGPTTAINGRVTNGTPDADIPSGIDVLLRVGLDTELVWQRTAVTDESGSFSFLEVPSDTRYAYAFDVTFEGALYRTVVEDGPPGEDVEIVVYAATASIDEVSVREDVLLLPRLLEEERRLVAMEAVTIENTGTRTLVPDLSSGVSTMNFLRFSLPPNAVGLDVRTELLDGQIIEVGEGFALVVPVPPGRHQVLFTYQLPYNGSSLDLERSFPFGASIYRVLLNQELGQVVGKDLVDMGPTDLGDLAYYVFETTELDRGAKASIRFEGLPAPSLLQRIGDLWTENTLIAIPVVLGGALVIFVAFAVLWRRRRQLSVVVDEDGEFPKDRAATVRAIAALDENFEEGEVSANHYRRRRDVLIGHLRKFPPDEESDGDVLNSESAGSDGAREQGKRG
ncbi:MAG: hypothetical protein C1O27_001134 [Chloroflexi bacterium]|nr:MAG: hypothetical protein C1O27_001134 [Chloroflexota bacterium]